MKYIIIAIGIFLLEAIREAIFSKNSVSRGKKAFMIIIAGFLAGLLIPYMIETLYLIIILEVVILFLIIYSFTNLNKKRLP